MIEELRVEKFSLENELREWRRKEGELRAENDRLLIRIKELELQIARLLAEIETLKNRGPEIREVIKIVDNTVHVAEDKPDELEQKINIEEHVEEEYEIMDRM